MKCLRIGVVTVLLSAGAFGAGMRPAVAATQQETGKNPPSSGTEEPKAEQTPPNGPRQEEEKNEKKTGGEFEALRYTPEAVGIAALFVLLLGFLFVFQVYYSKRLEQTGYLADVYRDSVETFEFNRLAAPHRERWANREYLQEAAGREPLESMGERLVELDEKWGSGALQRARNRRRDEISGVYSSWGQAGESGLGGGPLQRGPQTQEEREESEEYEREAKEFLGALEEWERRVTQSARLAYEKQLGEDRHRAGERAKGAVGSTDTSSLRGQGPRFVLEFVALIVIIFSAVVLGVLGRLEPEQIGTLLAAIAGYVLGRATSTQPAVREPTASSTVK